MRCQAMRSHRVTSDCSDGWAPGCMWLSPARGWALAGAQQVAVPPRTRPQSPPGDLEIAAGGMWRVGDPHFPSPGGGLCAQHAGGTGHVEYRQGLPASLMAPRAPWTTPEPLGELHPAPTLKSILRQSVVAGGLPATALVHCYGALYWKALRRNPHQGPQGEPAFENQSFLFCSAQNRTAEGGHVSW